MSRALRQSSGDSKAATSASATRQRATPESTRQVEERLQGGAPLPDSTRSRMERLFQSPFGDVRVHTGAVASDVADNYRADALTVGRKIAFGRDQYRPGTPSGDHLIAHELTHAVQQKGSGGVVAQARSRVSSASEPAEAEAERSAARVARGQPAGLGRGGAVSTRNRLMRRMRLTAPSRSSALATSPPVAGRRSADASAGAPSAVSEGAISTGDRPAARVGAQPRPPQARKGGLKKAVDAMPPAHTPDQAQLPIPEGETSPVAATTAGVPAGAGPGAAKPGLKDDGKKDGEGEKKKAEGEKEGEKKKEDKEKKDKEKKKKKKKGAGGGGGGGGARERKFGKTDPERGKEEAEKAKKRLTERSAAMQHHEPAGQRIEDARKAVEPPPNEGSSRAQAQQVDTVSGSEPPQPDQAAVKQDMRGNVDAAVPADMEEMGSMASSGAVQQIGQQLTGTIGSQVGDVRSTIGEVNTPPPPTEPPPAVPQPEPEPAPSTSEPGLAAATPPPVPDEALDASEFSEDADEVLGPELDDETLGKAQDGPLVELRGQKDELDTAVASSAEKARGGEAPALGEARGALKSQEGEAGTEFSSTRESEQQSVAGVQESTKTTEGGDRLTASEQIENIYKAATETVNGKLDGLTEAATQRFDTEQKQLLDDFSANTRSDLEDFKDDRYSGALGWTKWLKDRFVSINELTRVKAIYDRNRQDYISKVDSLIATITQDTEQTITDCNKTLEDARTEIQEIIDKLPEDAKAKALEAQQAAEESFQKMEGQIKEAEASVKKALADRRKKAIEDVDKALDEIKAENEALLDKLANFVNQLVEALGKFLRLMTRITRMGVGSFIASAAAQAMDGIKNHLWGALQEAFKNWIMQKIPFLQVLMNLPPNWMVMLTELATSLPKLFLDNLPGMLPAIGAAAMLWLATNLAAKLIPGAGAIMAVIDGVRAAWGLVQNLFSAAEAFFSFVMKVAQPSNGAMAFAKALAAGIVAGLDAVLTFLGVDRLIRRVGKAIAKPFGKIFKKLGAAFSKRRSKNKAKRSKERKKDKDDRKKTKKKEDPGEKARRKSAQEKAKRDRRKSRKSERKRKEEKAKKDAKKKESPEQKKKKREEERQRSKAEKVRKAVAAINPKVSSMMQKGVKGPILTARLALWKVRYRLSSLSVIETGKNKFKFRAVGSSQKTFGSGYQPTREEIAEAVRKAGSKLKKSARKGAEAKRPDTGKSMVEELADEGETSVRPGEDPFQMSAAIESQARADEARNVQLGVGGDTVRAKQAKGDPTNTEIFIPGVGGSRGPAYETFVRRLADEGFSEGPDLVEAMSTVSQGGSTGNKSADGIVRSLMVLQFGTESAREDAFAAASALSVAAMDKGAGVGQVLGSETEQRELGGGLNPATQSGQTAEDREATRAAREEARKAEKRPKAKKKSHPGARASQQLAEGSREPRKGRVGKERDERAADVNIDTTVALVQAAMAGSKFKSEHGFKTALGITIAKAMRKLKGE